MLDIPGPAHPLITLLDTREELVNLSRLPVSYVTTLYKISFVSKLGGQFRYGQGYYDFDEGSMVFTAPNQIVGSTAIYKGNEGYSLIFHQDFLQGYPLAAKIKQYGGISALRRKGTLSLNGLPPGGFDLPIFETVLNRYTIRDSIVGTRKDMQEAIEFAVDGKVKATVHAVKLDNINEVFEEMKKGEIAGRVVLDIANA